jgi:hypothetical protein
MNLFNYQIRKELVLVDINNPLFYDELLKKKYVYIKINKINKINNIKLLKCKISKIDQEEIQYISTEIDNYWKVTTKKIYANNDLKFYIDIPCIWIEYFIQEIRNLFHSYDFLLQNKIIKYKMTKKMIVLFDNYLILNILSFL